MYPKVILKGIFCVLPDNLLRFAWQATSAEIQLCAAVVIYFIVILIYYFIIHKNICPFEFSTFGSFYYITSLKHLFLSKIL